MGLDHNLRRSLLALSSFAAALFAAALLAVALLALSLALDLSWAARHVPPRMHAMHWTACILILTVKARTCCFLFLCVCRHAR